ncbi:MAG: HAD family hydrolase [Phycisphaerae bacterium]|nr:HAD family hydrolase [Phycisphaerae bacterium]
MNDWKCALLGIDLDGTLLDSRGKLPDRNREALHRAHERGVKVVVCTGRPFPEARPILEAIGLDLDAVVSCSGALISRPQTGETIRRTEFEPTALVAIRGWLSDRQLVPIWIVDDPDQQHDGFVVSGGRRHSALESWLRRTPCRIRPVDEWPSSPTPIRLAVIDEPPVLGPLAAAFEERFREQSTVNLLRAPQYELSIMEVAAAKTSKWTAIEWLCGQWGLNPRHTAAVGDDVNDIDMLRNAGRGFAMANAKPGVAEHARERTGANDDCGVADVVQRCLGE